MEFWACKRCVSVGVHGRHRICTCSFWMSQSADLCNGITHLAGPLKSSPETPCPMLTRNVSQTPEQSPWTRHNRVLPTILENCPTLWQWCSSCFFSPFPFSSYFFFLVPFLLLLFLSLHLLLDRLLFCLLRQYRLLLIYLILYYILFRYLLRGRLLDHGGFPNLRCRCRRKTDSTSSSQRREQH